MIAVCIGYFESFWNQLKTIQEPKTRKNRAKVFWLNGRLAQSEALQVKYFGKAGD